MTDDGEDSTSQSMSPDSMDEERPLKKARYVWQIKSRYRLGHARGRGCSRVRHQSASAGVSSEQQRPATGDQCPVVRWQTRQMARAVVDNTINQVLQDMGFAPVEESDEDPISFDIMYPGSHNREGIENEAVLMAIQSHGLQKPCMCSHSLSAPPSATPSIPFHHRPSTPIPVEECAPSTSRIESQEKYAGESDFLAQAVAVAIQKKGLGSYSLTEHG